MLDKETVEKLNQYPEPCERVKQMLADVAEQRIIDEMGGLGHDLLQSWATQQADKTAMRAKAHKPGLRKHVKKR